MPKRKIIPYDEKLMPLAKQLRDNMTFEEVLLWNQLKGKQLGVDFDRQRPIDNFIVDFYCKELCLAIEVDGSDHEPEKDEIRQQRLEKLGVYFLRFSNHDIKTQMGHVLDTIATWILDNKLD